MITFRPLLVAVCAVWLAVGTPTSARADPWYRSEPVLGVVDAGRQAEAARRLGVTWDRVLFLWQEIQPDGPDDWRLDEYLERARLGPSLESGLPLAAVVQGTPAWAATDPRDKVAAVPVGLEHAAEDPRNPFGRFMRRLTHELRGRVHAWIIWNEPDFRPGDSGDWWTWTGSPDDLFRLLRTGYHAVKAADPTATVVFPATAYFVDAVNRRELYLSRTLRAAEADPEAARHGFYFDVVAVNLYCSLDAVYRVPWLYAQVLARYGLAKPLWLTETNCPAYNDAAAPLDPYSRISTEEQAAFLIQAVALARASGVQRIGWYGMVDHAEESGIEDRWGLLRPDGTARPAWMAYEVAAQYLGGSEQVARFAPVPGETRLGGWLVWRVILDAPAARQRVQVLWRGFEGPDSVRLEAHGAYALVVDRFGRTTPARRVGGWWEVALPPPRPPRSGDPPGFQAIGDPVLLVEEEVAPDFPLRTPTLRY